MCGCECLASERANRRLTARGANASALFVPLAWSGRCCVCSPIVLRFRGDHVNDSMRVGGHDTDNNTAASRLFFNQYTNTTITNKDKKTHTHYPQEEVVARGPKSIAISGAQHKLGTGGKLVMFMVLGAGQGSSSGIGFYDSGCGFSALYCPYTLYDFARPPYVHLGQRYCSVVCSPLESSGKTKLIRNR